jgi:hypothetical protein
MSKLSANASPCVFDFWAELDGKSQQPGMSDGGYGFSDPSVSGSYNGKRQTFVSNPFVIEPVTRNWESDCTQAKPKPHKESFLHFSSL